MTRRPARATTISDVAARAGVSTATVSLALNGRKDVSAVTRARVEAIAAELGFRPNRVAKSLRTGTSSVIAVVIPDLGNPFYGGLAQGVVAAARRAGLHVVVAQTTGAMDRQDVEALLDYQCDGFIFTSLTADEAPQLRALQHAGIPFVQLIRELPELGADFVGSDDRAGGAAAARHLVQLGHERVAVVAGPQASSASKTRLAGMRRALSQGGHPLDRDLLEHGDLTRPVAYALTDDILRRSPVPPTALLCGNDVMALGAWDALHDHGLRVPHDVSIVGYDDMAFAGARAIGLTTVAQPQSQLGEEALRVLLDRRARPKAPTQRVVLPNELVVRTSTAPPGGGP